MHGGLSSRCFFVAFPFFYKHSDWGGSTAPKTSSEKTNNARRQLRKRQTKANAKKNKTHAAKEKSENNDDDDNDLGYPTLGVLKAVSSVPGLGLFRCLLKWRQRLKN